MDNRQLLERLNIDTSKIKTSGKTLCPNCSHTRNNKKDPCLSVDVITGVYNCHNNCGFSGGVANTYDRTEKVYVRPKFINTTELSEKGVNWFFTERAITQITLNKARITESVEYMPQLQREANCINFNYFRDEKLVNTKFRAVKKSFKMIKDAELIFYNIDSILRSSECIITEGEIDCISFIQSGVESVISVPNGASLSKKANLEYLDNCIDYFDNKKTIILATDNDEAGIALREELARRLGYERCKKVSFGDCKDANEYLKKYGEAKLKKIIHPENLKDFPISGIITVDMVWDEVENYFRDGLNRGAQTGKLEMFDELVSFVEGQMMVVTGIPNHGKSPFTLFIMACLSLRYGWKWAFFTPEHKPLSIYITKICELILGKRVRKGVGFTDREKQLAYDFISKYFFFIQPSDDNLTLDNILEKAELLVKQKGINGLLIDPWNKLEHNIESNQTEHNYVSKELDKLIKFNQRNKVFAIVVAHPKKMMKKPKSDLYEVPSLYDISGSSNWFNKPDIGITFYRNFTTGLSEIYVNKFKYEHLGSQGMTESRFNMNNSRMTNTFGEWDNNNWLIPEEPQLDLITPEMTNEELPF
jgi:twinkle protein